MTHSHFFLVFVLLLFFLNLTVFECTNDNEIEQLTEAAFIVILGKAKRAVILSIARVISSVGRILIPPFCGVSCTFFCINSIFLIAQLSFPNSHYYIRILIYKYLRFLSKGAQTLLVKPRLPPEDKDFMGRGKECEEIMSHLSSESTRIASIFGPAGFGKSQVANAVGNDLKFQGKTVYHLELRRVQNKKELISKFLCNFNVSPNCRDLEPEDSLYYQLSQVKGHLYFILDNADRVLEPNVKDDVINLIKEILTKFSNVTFIVTARESPTFLHLESLGQILIRVGGLGKFYCKNLVQKLLPDSNDDERKKIVQLCGYMPFAIILMCRSITQSKKPLNEALDDFIRSTKSIVRELDDPEDISDSRLIGIFGSSFGSLQKYDKEAFVTLSVIPGSFDEDVATAVLGKSKSKAEMTLKRLHRRSLIDSSSGSYQMHKLLQSFGSEKGQNEMNEVFRNAKTRFEEYYISIFSKLNETFFFRKIKVDVSVYCFL